VRGREGGMADADEEETREATRATASVGGGLDPTPASDPATADNPGTSEPVMS
jgi:hypothetical protein